MKFNDMQKAREILNELDFLKDNKIMDAQLQTIVDTIGDVDMEFSSDPSYMPDVQIKMKDGGKKPSWATEFAAGLDVFANVEAEKIIAPGEVMAIGVGFSWAVPNGWRAEIKERSGLGSNGIGIRGRIIDSDFRGEVKILLHNLSDTDLIINNHNKIAQIVFERVYKPKLNYVEELNETERGENGFGSTGT